MQYILTQEEFDALNSTKKASRKLSDKQLQTLCTKIADTMPIRLNWGPWKDEPTPWVVSYHQKMNGIVILVLLKLSVQVKIRNILNEAI